MLMISLVAIAAPIATGQSFTCRETFQGTTRDVPVSIEGPQAERIAALFENGTFEMPISFTRDANDKGRGFECLGRCAAEPGMRLAVSYRGDKEVNRIVISAS